MQNKRVAKLVSASLQSLSIADASQTGLDLSTTLTITAWVKFDSLGDLMTIVSKHQSGGGDDYGYLLRLRTGGTPTYRLDFLAAETLTSGDNHVYADWDVAVDTWYHVAVTYDGGANEVKFYVDGSQLGSTQTMSTNDISNNSTPFNIGARYNGGTPTNFFDGKIDEVTVWNDVRTSTEISDEYNSGDGIIYGGDETGLVGYWRFEDTVSDYSSNGNHLTNNNSAQFVNDVPFTGSYVSKDHSVDFESGSSQYLSRATQTGLDSLGDYTFSAWIKLESNPSGDYDILCRRNTTEGYTFFVRNRGSGNYDLAFQTKNSSGNYSSYYTSDADTYWNPDLETWYHVVATFDYSENNVEFYINGSKYGSTVSQTNSLTISSAALSIGAWSTGADYFDGKISEIAVYNAILDSTAISALYNSGDGYIHDGTETNLVSAWNLNGDLLDVSSNANHLTNNNSAVLSMDTPFYGALLDKTDVYVEDFESYSTGDLNGQGSWSGSTDIDVQTGTVYEGTKAISDNSAGDDAVEKTITAVTADYTDGYFMEFHVRCEYDTDATSYPEATLMPKISDSIIGRFRFAFRNAYYAINEPGVGYQSVGVPVKNTWYKGVIQWDFTNEKCRTRLDDGFWSDWYDFENTASQIDKIRFVISNSATNGKTFADLIQIYSLAEASGSSPSSSESSSPSASVSPSSSTSSSASSSESNSTSPSASASESEPELPGSNCTVDQEITEAGIYAAPIGFNSIYHLAAQSFVVSTTNKACAIKVYLSKVGSPTDNITCGIYTDDSGPDTLLRMADNKVDSSKLPSTPTDQEKTFIFTDGPELQSGTKYHFVLAREGSDNSSNYAYASLIGSGTDTYSGMEASKSNGSWSWSPYSFATYQDLRFKQYSDLDASDSASQSPSASLSPSSSVSASASSSGSSSLSPSSSGSPSPSASPSPGTKDYSKGNYATLPTGIDDLENIYNSTEKLFVTAIDSAYVSQSATGEYAIHQFKNTTTGDNAVLTWSGKSELPPSSYPVVLQIYNRYATTWETVDTNNVAAAGADFILTATKEGLTNYKDGNGTIVCRVYQGV